MGAPVLWVNTDERLATEASHRVNKECPACNRQFCLGWPVFAKGLEPRGAVEIPEKPFCLLTTKLRESGFGAHEALDVQILKLRAVSQRTKFCIESKHCQSPTMITTNYIMPKFM